VSRILHDMTHISWPVKLTLACGQYESYQLHSNPTNGASLGSYECNPHLHTLFQIYFNNTLSITPKSTEWPIYLTIFRMNALPSPIQLTN